MMKMECCCYFIRIANILGNAISDWTKGTRVAPEIDRNDDVCIQNRTAQRVRTNENMMVDAFFLDGLQILIMSIEQGVAMLIGWVFVKSQQPNNKQLSIACPFMQDMSF